MKPPGSGSLPTAQLPSLNLGSQAQKVTTSWCWRTRPRCTMRWCARSARATRGRCWACPPTGTRAHRTAREWCAIRVWDSSAEVRYLVLPMRPADSDDMSEDELAALVTRDAMIGVARL